MHDRALAEALAGAETEGVTGQRLTPYLLAALVEATEGAALEANLAAVRGNVRLGARIAVAFARCGRLRPAGAPTAKVQPLGGQPQTVPKRRSPKSPSPGTM